MFSEVVIFSLSFRRNTIAEPVALSCALYLYVCISYTFLYILSAVSIVGLGHRVARCTVRFPDLRSAAHETAHLLYCTIPVQHAQTNVQTVQAHDYMHIIGRVSSATLHVAH